MRAPASRRDRAVVGLKYSVRAILLEPLEARQLLAFGGQGSGVFENPQPPWATVTGVGTSTFTWGQAVQGSSPSSLTFAGESFLAQPGATFSLGTLTYFNGRVTIGTEATSVDLRPTTTFTVPAGVPPVQFSYPLQLISTPNDPNPDEPDIVRLALPGYPSQTFNTPDGQTYTLEIVGFGQVTGDGTTTIDEFRVLEDGTAEADLLARFVAPQTQLTLRVDETQAAGLAGGAFSVEQGHPFRAALDVENLLRLWFSVTPSHSAGNDHIEPGGGIDGLLAQAGLINPRGHVAYKAQFDQVGDTARVTMNFDLKALVPNMLEFILKGLPVGVPTPAGVVTVLQDFQNLPGVRNAIDDLTPLPTTAAQWLLAAGKIAKDLHKVMTSNQQVSALQGILQRLGFTVSETTIKKTLKLKRLADLMLVLADEIVLFIQTGGHPFSVGFIAERAVGRQAAASRGTYVAGQRTTVFGERRMKLVDSLPTLA